MPEVPLRGVLMTDTHPSALEPLPSGSVERDRQEAPLTVALRAFLGELDALAQSLPLIMGVAQLVEKDTGKKVETFLEKYGAPVEPKENGAPRAYSLPADHILAFRPLDKRFT